MKKGDIYFANLDGTIGSEQGGGRPVVIIQNNKGNDHAPTVIVAAMTSKHKPSLPTHVVVRENVKVTSLVLCEQIRTIDKSRLERKLGSVSEETLKKIDRAMMISLGIVR
jgi:mRNA interferase MazF